MASQVSLIANLGGFLLELFPVGQAIKEKVENINNWITALSFAPYSMDGILNGLKKKSIWEALAFTLEAPFAIAGAMGGIGDIFVARGASAGADQLPSAAEKVLTKLGIVDAKTKQFSSWKEGFVELPKAIFKLTKEIFTQPIKSLFNFEKGFFKDHGHLTVLSSIGDIASSVGYLFTGRKYGKALGLLRGASSLIFDGALLSHEKKAGKSAGVLFIAEAVLDTVARYCGSFGPAINQLAHGCGRLACEFYKNTFKAETA